MLAKNRNERLLDIVRERLELAKTLQQEVWRIPTQALDSEVFKDIPERNMQLLKGAYWDTVIRTTTETSDMLIRRSSNLILPKLASKIALLDQGVTEFFLEPRMKKYEKVVEKAEGLLNYSWVDHQMDRVITRLQWDSEVYGFGVAEIGWRFERDGVTLEGERGEPNVNPDAMPLSPDILAAYDMNPEMALYENDAEAESMALELIKRDDDITWATTYDDIFFRRIPPRHFYFDPNSTCWDLSDARYCIKLEYVQLSKVKNNKTYNKCRKDVVGGIYAVRDDVSSAMAINDKTRSDAALVKLYHMYGYFDLDETGSDKFYHVVFTAECDEPLLVEEVPYEFGTSTPFPFRILPGIAVDNDIPYPESSINQVADLQLSYDEAYSQLTDLRRRAMRMYLVAKGSLDKDAVRKFEIGRDNSIIEVEEAFLDSIKPFPQIPSNIEIYKDLDNTPNEIQRSLGVSEFTEAMTPTRKMLATEVRAIQGAGATRVNGCYENQQDFKQDIAYCIICLYQQFANRDYHFSLTDGQGNKQYDSANMIDLLGEDPLTGELDKVGVQFKVKINTDSVTNTNRGEKVAEQVNIISQLTPFIEAGLINPTPLLRTLLKLAKVDNLDEVLNTQQLGPDPNTLPPDMVETPQTQEPPMTDGSGLPSEAAMGLPLN